MSIAGACALAVLPGMALAAPTAPYTVLTVDVGDQTGGYPIYQSDVFDRDNSTISVVAQSNDRLAVDTTRAGSYVRLSIQPPAGEQWTAGQTYQATWQGDGGTAAMDLASDGRGCGHVSGWIKVRQADRDSDTGRVDAFAAAYEYSCRDSTNYTGTVSGELRWNSSVDYAVAHGEPNPVSFNYQEIAVPSAARTVTFRSVGSAPVTFGAASLGGPTPGAFALLGSNCTGRTLAPGQTCTVSVAANPTKEGVQQASLLLADDSASGTRRVQLAVEGFRGVTGSYYPLTPKRLMDTRSGLGAPKAKIGPGKKVDLQVTGRGGVPSSGVGSVVLNVTVVGPTAGSFLTLYPAGQSRPTASSINFAKSWLGSNSVTVKVGSGGKVSVYNHAGSTDVVVDVAGVWAGNNSLSSRGPGGQYQWIKPYRLYDTRDDGAPLPATYYMESWLSFGNVNANIRALVVNITAVSPRKAGYLTAWTGQGDVPTASTVNYPAGKVVPNLAIVETVECTECGGKRAPQFAIYTSQTTHLVVDVVGVIDDGTVPDGLRFTPMSPTRIADSRIGQGLPSVLGPTAVGKVTAPASMLTPSTQVLAMNVTAVTPTSNTVLTVWPADSAMTRPTASNLNPAAGQTVSNAVLGILGPTQGFNVYNHSGNTHVVADVVGTLWVYPGTATPPTGRATSPGSRFKVIDSGVGTHSPR
ncbi:MULTISPECIES: choice-of-anchor D domain-containing protein [unclassified Micromonospora]|uniref:choice-of-anchor D domain-containing protein n=1 Tax=unclassified Micromonospora TaxID=2617518 RepID=UPI001C5F80E5|nr:choice-of-anchor D domain-containing protein [Micromonospora sp. RL09-050-HVF-A]MBW4703847.1 choice-of-anchor D domain-containing protein [Micromonospora sp. RL09-050-HVF-A]